MKNPQAVADKWAAKLGASGQAIKDGIDAVTTSPTLKAAQQVDRYVMGVQEAASSGKWQRGLQKVSLQDWKDAMTNKGLTRITSGATAAKPKMAAFMQKLLPYQDNVVKQLDSMPRGGLQENIARAVFVMQKMSEFKNT
jgi:hypothetical protein